MRNKWKLPKVMTNHPISRRLRDSRLGSLLLDDAAFRTTALLCQGLIVNGVYAVFRYVTAIYYHATWFYAIAGYYTVLCVIRLLLILRSGKAKELKDESARRAYELKTYGLCGGLTVLLHGVMSGIIYMIVRQNQHFSYPGYLVFLTGLYTFYAVIMAVVNAVRFRKLNNPILSASKALALVCATMSLLILQTALISQFGEEAAALRQIANFLTGAAVSVLTLATAVYMIVHAKRELASLQKKNKPVEE